MHLNANNYSYKEFRCSSMNQVSIEIGTPISAIRTLVVLDRETINSMPFLPVSYKEKRAKLSNDIYNFLNHFEKHGFDGDILPLVKSMAYSFSVVHLAHLKLGVEIALAVLAFLSGVGEAVLILIIILIVLEAIESYLDQRDYNYLSVILASIPFLKYLKGAGPVMSKATALLKMPQKPRVPVSVNPFNDKAFSQMLEQSSKQSTYAQEWGALVDDLLSALKKSIDDVIKDPRIQASVKNVKDYLSSVQKTIRESRTLKPNCMKGDSRLYQNVRIPVEQLEKQLANAKIRLKNAEQILSKNPSSQMAKDAVAARKAEVETICRKIRQAKYGF